ncbi:DUF190 domain-containing protein [bacterium]|nr:MAG: DUF190 domain-containing protein [bacterium]
MSAARLVRVYVREAERHHGRPLHRALLLRLAAGGFPGCVTFKAIAGYGSHAGMRTARIFELSQDLPVVIEIVLQEERVEALFALFDEMLVEALVTSERIETVKE